MFQLRAQTLVAIFLVWVLGYFTYHAVYGQRGYLVLRKKRVEFARAEKQLLQRKAQQNFLARNVSLMKQKIDPDLLEQQAWILLRQLPADRRVIFMKPKN